MKIIFTTFLLTVFGLTVYSQTGSEGFYKDIFMDGGVNLYSKTSLPAIDSLNYSYEFIATENQTTQNNKIVGNTDDTNGVLLYPDGEPRFKAIYTNGGSATNHGTSLGENGRNNIRTFFYKGGSYTGSCAGAFLTSVNYQPTGTNNSYYHIWPGRTHTTGVMNTYTGHFIDPNSPLLSYFDFGNDLYISHVYHTGGCYAREDIDYPINTEVLLRFDYAGNDINNKVSSWAYKENDESGRLVVIGSHPERETSGEQLHLMEAMMMYAIAGQGVLQLKAELQNGVARDMDKLTEDNNPAYTKIGDKQYQHFTINLPENSSNFNISVVGESGYHLNIYVNKDNFAFRSNALFMDISDASSKTLDMGSVSAGLYYISVECETTVETTTQSWGNEYTSNTDVLNGVAYTIQANWSAPAGLETNNNTISVYPNPSNGIFTLKSSNLTATNICINDISGRQILNKKLISNTENVDISNYSNGIYILSVKIGNQIIKKTIIKNQ